MMEQRNPRHGLVERLAAALLLDLRLYEEVSLDSACTAQAVRVVLLAGVSNGLGLAYRLGTVGILAGVGAALLGWALWAGVILLTARLFGHRRQGRSLVRALGFANSPGLFLILGVIPVVGGLVRAAVVGWLVATTVRATQAVFVVSTRRAILVSVIGLLEYLVLGIVSAQFAS